MSTFNDKPTPGADNPPVNYIPFKRLEDLRRAMEKLDFINRMNSALLREVLDLFHVPYSELDNGNIILEKGALTGPGVEPGATGAVADVINHSRNRIAECFKSLGVITTAKPFEGDESPKIYEGLIDILNNRNN
jgi:hypothetical protein